jgi:DNA-directed RNA polymerase subunit RPC12/RpoP
VKKKSPKMKTAEDAEVKDALEEAGEDLEDARNLAARGAAMGLYHASQAAEKYVRAVAVAAGRPSSAMWDLPRAYAAVEDVEGMDAIAEAVKVLAEFATPPKAQGHGGRLQLGIRAARAVRATCLKLLSVAVEEEPPFTAEMAAPPPAPPPQAAAPARDLESPPLGTYGTPGPEPAQADPPRPGRFERTNAYVKSVLFCATCGVQLPRTRQTVHGAPCPHCGRPMTLKPM